LRFLAAGSLGVDLFFVLSGFLIGSILLKNKESNSFFSTFYIRRIFRIIPIYYLILTVTLVILINKSLFFINAWDRVTLPIATYYTFTQNIYMSLSGFKDTEWLLPTWTLAVEEQFYLILPLMIRFISEKMLLRVVCTLILSAPIVRILLSLSGELNPIAMFVLLPCRWDLLFIGVLAAIILRNESLRLPLMVRDALPLKIGALAAAAIVVFLSLSDRYYGTQLGYTLALLPIGICFACYILLILRDSEEGRMFHSDFWQFFGHISYGLYLIHQPVAGILHGCLLGSPPDIENISQILVTLLALALSIFIAWLSWRLFESRLIAFGHKWQYNSLAK